MDPRASLEQEIPMSYNGFVFLIRGTVTIGEDAALVKTGQVGWLDRLNREGSSVLRTVAGEEGARLVLYAGQPQGNPIVSYGPFIADSKEDIVRLYTEYRAGQFVRMSELAGLDG
jgi:redox-sensitive bicupin YhaK (pirin superfamily)